MAAFSGLISLMRSLLRQAQGVLDTQRGSRFKTARLETILLQFIHCTTLTTLAQFSSALLAFASSMFDGELCATLAKFVGDLYDQFGSRDATACTEQAGEARTAFGSFLEHYRDVRHSVLAQKLRRIAAMCIAGGFLGNGSPTQDAVLRHLSAYAGKAEWDAWDFGDELLYLIQYTWDVVVECTVQRSFYPLLGTASAVKVIESERAFLRAHIDWYLVGSLTRVTGADGAVVQPADFVLRATAHQISVRKQHKQCSHPAERAILARYMQEADSMHAQILERISRTTTRVEPICIKLDGTTGVGKSAVMNTLMRDLLRIVGRPHTDAHVSVVDTGAKYMDTVTNITQGIIMDDVANTLPQFATVDELVHILKIKNTIKTPVNKAAVEEKGGTFLDAAVLLVSTNAPMLGADQTSCEPSAILRRFAWHIDVTVGDGYAHENNGRYLRMLDPSTLTEGIYTYAQRFRVRQYMPLARGPGRERDHGVFVTLREGLNYSELMEYLAPEVRGHFARQAVRMADMAAAEGDVLCEHGFTTARNCHLCRAPQQPVEQAGDDRRPSWFDRLPSMEDIVLGPRRASFQPAVPDQPEALPPVPESLPLAVTIAVRAKVAWFRTREWLSHMTSGETPLTATVAGVSRLVLGRCELEELFITRPVLFLFATFGFVPTVLSTFTGAMFWAFGVNLGFLSFATVFGWWSYAVSSLSVSCVRARVAGGTLAHVRQLVAKRVGQQLGVGIFVILTTIGSILLYRGLTAPPAASGRRRRCWDFMATADCSSHYGFEEHGGACGRPTSGQEQCSSSVPDPVVRPDVWIRRDLTTFGHAEGPVATMAAEHIWARIKRQLFISTFYYGSGNVVQTHALMVCTNVAILPAHNFVSPDGKYVDIKRVEFRTTTGECGPVFTAKVGESSLYRLSGDLVLFQTNAGGTMVDLSMHFADIAPTGRVPTVELSRDFNTCGTLEMRYMSEATKVASDQYSWVYDGFRYQRSTDSFKGLCGAALVTDSRYPFVFGFHTMGNKQGGMAVRVLRADVKEGLDALRDQNAIRGPIVSQPTTQVHTPPGLAPLGKLVTLAYNSTMREAPTGAPFIPYGTLENYVQSRPKSRLGTSPISALVEKVCGEPRQHGPPKNIGKATVAVAKYKEWAEIVQLDPDVLKMASVDLQDELISIVERGSMACYLKPLTEVEACSGIPQSLSVKRISVNTAAGWPYVGPKTPFLEACPFEGSPDAIRLTPTVRMEVQELEDKMARCERVNFVYKASHKDEPTKIGKEKTRIFEGSPMVLTFLVRKFFLPIMRVYMLAQLQTGCAVGIDATGAQWNDMCRYLMEYNPRDVLEGDWRHYDTSLAYQEMMAVFTIWIELAEKFGNYAQREIAIMWVLAEEVCRHFAMVSGDVCMVDGTNPSGNPLTVFINNACNGLRMRCAFYALAPSRVGIVKCDLGGGTTLAGVPLGARRFLRPLRMGLTGRYADFVREMFYGDDFLLAAKPAVLSWFNQETIAEWFAGQGKVMTSPTKGPVVETTTPWWSTSFLKRSVKFDTELGVYVGPLAISSIYKSLHVWPVKLPWAPPVHCAEIMGGVIRELFLHGRQAFDTRVPALLRVAEEFGARPYMDSDITYDKALTEWVCRCTISGAGERIISTQRLVNVLTNLEGQGSS